MMLFLQRLLRSDAGGGLLLIFSACVAMVLANNNLTREGYLQFLSLPLDLRAGPLTLHFSLVHWVNDALMALFFLQVGLEVKRELREGALANRRQAAFPAIAALGGMLAPALIFLLFNRHDVVARDGWAIPTATDIAFALGILALLGNRVPVALKVFLMALAIIDDLGAIVIIALFYTSQLSMTALAVALGAILVLGVLNQRNVQRVGLYMLVGIILWVAVLKSGIHATLAGVIIGLLIPLKTPQGGAPARTLAHVLHPWVAFIILPLFAFTNAGVPLQGVALSDLFSLLPVGIIAGLLIGKPLGIGLFCWLSVRFGLAVLPQGTNLKDILVVGVLCGIGFTMSIFITSLAFDSAHSQLIDMSRLGILLGSCISGVIGYSMLRARFPAPSVKGIR